MRYFYCPNFNPVVFSIGGVSLHWYGLMYLIGFLFAKWFLGYRQYSLTDIDWKREDIEYLLYLNFLGVLLGGRLGYVVLYQWSFFSKNILWIFKVWEGGMSFHGGLIGVILSIFWFSYQKRCSFFKVSDFVVPSVPVGLGLGRLGNFINGELWGRVSPDTPWSMLFINSIPQDLLLLEDNPRWRFLFEYYGALPRHPSQLYEMFLEGVLLFIIINLFAHKSRPAGSISGLFLICYGIFRILVECFRQPDSQIGLINNMFTLGQILSLPMVFFGSIITYFVYKAV